MLTTDQVHKITDKLEHEANLEKAKRINEIEAYYAGYNQACEDFGRKIRLELITASKGEKNNAKI